MRYGPDFSEKHVLEDGTHVTLRSIQPTDAPELLRQFHRMSPDSRYRRFFSGISELSPELLRYLTECDGEDHLAIVAVVDSLDLKEDIGVGVARFVRLREAPNIAEAAVTVTDDFQGRGIGRLLMTTLVLAAQERGITKFRGEVLASNEPMRKLLEENGVIGTPVGGESGTLVFDVPIGTEEVGTLRRILRDTAASLIVWLSRLYPSGWPRPERS